MRVWDVNPGYLNQQSLLGEHREIHAIVSILTDGMRGYARHPETRRWAKALWALKTRHDLVVSEMELRGYHHRSPVLASRAQGWPEAFIDTTAIRTLTVTHQVSYLLESTALSELRVWIPDARTGSEPIPQAWQGNHGTGAG
jgi:Pyrimidine dimer DNA glycosylase